VGTVLAVATVTCVLLDVVEAQQAIALVLPSALFIAVGLIVAAVPDAATARRHGFQVGLRAGKLLSLCRALFYSQRRRPLAAAGGGRRLSCALPAARAMSRIHPLAPKAERNVRVNG
jgi:hypothetical protein